MSLSRALITKIQVARSQTGIDEDSYRAMLFRISNGKTNSAKGLTITQAEKVIEEFKEKGWKPAVGKRAKGKPHNFNLLPGEIAKIEALLADMKLTWSYADSIAQQMYKIEKVAWLKKPAQFTAILAALHVEQEKRGLLDQVEALCKELGVSDPERIAGLEQLPVGWRRQRPILKALVDTLAGVAVARREACAS